MLDCEFIRTRCEFSDMTLVLITCAIFYLPLIDQQHTPIEELVFGGYTIVRIYRLPLA